MAVTVNKETVVLGGLVNEGWVDGNGVMTFTGLGAGTYTITELVAPDGYNKLDTDITVVISFDENGATKWSATKDGETLTENNDGLFAFNVVNKAGTQLPSTGGMGTTILYVGGGLLIAAALILLVAKKRTAAFM